MTPQNLALNNGLKRPITTDLASVNTGRPRARTRDGTQAPGAVTHWGWL